MNFLYLIFYACLRLRFLDVETNPGPWRPVPDVCRILCSNVRGLAGNLSDLILASSQYDILLRSVTLVFLSLHMAFRYASRVRVAGSGFGGPVLLCRGKMPRAQGMAANVRAGYGEFRRPKFQCGCWDTVEFGVCGVRQNLCVQSLPQP